ncbi:hypothetical protein O7622_05580 [Micromonospora sp. WMMD1076]|uniref:hypothetical protein n=1 Tax=Micromonospora sp. WMMD1076 TaxID=3016103 RepID=UPI002499C859|nr:hypothetical protein [Micromonospora sp. WMMD1076]WFF08045.1 hypothetical protein O7622_05580 [Micromonospora sp. WMMD1076]
MKELLAATLQTWAQQASPEQLRAGPGAADLGGRSVVAAAADDLASSPLFAYLIDLAGTDEAGPSDPQRAQLDQAVLRGIAEHDRYTSYTSAVSRLLTYPTLTKRLGRALESALQKRAEAGIDAHATPAVAAIGATATEAWLHLCTTGVLREHRLLGFLTDLPDSIADVALEMATRLPRIVGLVHEHFHDDDLLMLLQRLADIPEAEADAGFELALADLRRALDADNQDELIPALARARSGFAAVEACDEARHDAQAYAAAIDAIMAFGWSDPTPLHDAVTRLEAAVHQHRAWLSGGYQPPWNWARVHAETAWLQLSMTLTAAAEPLHDACWYHPSQALAALLDAYQAGRSFAAHTNGGGPGVEVLIQPAIEGTFLRDANRLALLDRALAHDPSLADDDAAQQLHTAIHAAITTRNTASRATTPPSTGGDRLGKDLSRLTAVLHHFGIEDAASLVKRAPPHLQEVMESLLWNDEIAQAETGNVKVERKLQELQRELAGSPDWSGPMGGPFTILLRQTMLFLSSRYNIGATMGGQRTAYLRSSGGTAPLEKPLHQDYFEWLSQGPLYNTLQAEPINRGRGRADVLVRFRNASFCVECKREQDDATRDGLRTYAGQAAVYTDTDAAFGILLALDLTTPTSGSPDLFSSIWVERVQREREDDPRYIVIARLPGNKPHPSATTTPPRRP